MIHVEKLNKSYSKNQVLHNLNFSTINAKVYGIVGANGAGKTTFYRCISKLEACEGTITWAENFDKNRLGYLQTNPFFFEKMTGREYLQLLVQAKKIKDIDLDQNNVFELPLSEYAANYSTGMKKKLAFTGLLLQGNDFIILDEPFNGVDIQSNIIITEIIKKWKEMGKTILISSHIFSTLSSICDEIHLLENGAFAQKVGPENFDKLEEKMKQFILGDKLENLDWR